jgi:hypothetical protein
MLDAGYWVLDMKLMGCFAGFMKSLYLCTENRIINLV